MEYRLRLGQYLDDTDLVVDGGFVAVCGVNWTCAAGWNIAAGIATHAGAYSFLQQAGVFNSDGVPPNTIKYRVNFDISGLIAPGILKLYAGDYHITSFTADANGSYSFDLKCLDAANDDIRLGGFQVVSIDNVECFNWKWNDPLIDQPSFTDTKIIIGEGELLKNLLSCWKGNIILDGDGYTYLKDIYDNLGTDEYCDKIDILIERNNNGTWERHFEGYIFMTDCDFDFKQQIVTIKKLIGLVEDIAERLNEQQIVIEPYGQYEYVNPTSATGAVQTVNYRDCGLATWTDTAYAMNVFQALRYVTMESTTMSVLLESAYFNVGGTREYYGLATDDLISTIVPPSNTDPFRIFITFENFTTNLNTIFNMGIIDRFDDNIPTLVFEPKADLGGTAHSWTLTSVNAEIVSYSVLNNYASVEIGYQEGTEFQGYAIYKFNSNANCAENELGLVCDWIADDTFIDDVNCIAQTTELYIALCCVDNAGTLEARCHVGDASYNTGTATIQMMINHVWSLQSSFTGPPTIGNAAKPNEVRIKQVEIETKLTLSQLNDIRNNPNYLINIDVPEYNLDDVDGYIVDFEWDNETHIAKFKLLI